MSEFDFDELLSDTDEVVGRAQREQQWRDTVDTVSMAHVVFNAVSILYMEERLANPGMPMDDAIAAVKARIDMSVEEYTKPYMLRMFEYNDIVSKTRWESEEEALEHAVKMERKVIEMAFKALEHLVARQEPFVWLTAVASGKLPEEVLESINEEEDDSLGSMLDNLTWS